MDSSGVTVVIATVGGTLVLCGVVAWFVFANMRKQAYQGVVVKKTEEEREGANDNPYTVYTLVIKTDDGQQKAVNVGKKLWEEFKEGDRIIKEVGKLNPRKG